MSDTALAVRDDTGVGILDRLTSFLGRFLGQENVEKLLPLIMILCVIGGGLIVYALYSAEQRSVLFPNLAETDKVAVIEALMAVGVAAKVDSVSGRVTVPRADYYNSRAILAAQGLPSSVASGYDVLDSMPVGASRSIEATRIRQSQEVELAQSIAEIGGIASARVHLAIVERSIFVRESQPPTASVFLRLKPGRALGENQVRAIIHLVSSSVPMLTAERVSVVDQYGALLSQPVNDPDMALNNTQLQYKIKLEKYYKDRVVGILGPLYGAGNVQTSLNIDIDFTRQEIRREIIAPDNNAILSEQSTLDETSSPQAMGVPGALTNEPPLLAELTDLPTEQGAEASSPTQRSTSSVKNYQIGREVETTMPGSGIIEKVNVAVIIKTPTQMNELGELIDVPLEEQQIASSESLVRNALGLDEERGDSLTIQASTFYQPVPEVPQPIYQQDWFFELSKQVLTILGLALITFGALRPILSRAFMPPEQALAEQLDYDGEQILLEEGESLDDIKAKLKPKKAGISAELLDTANTYDDKVAIIRMIVADEPGRVSSVFKSIMRREVEVS
jgi:flagellar M-ring protein FliF